MARRPTVAVDFDGVIHSYVTPWLSEAHCPDPPVPGAIPFLGLLLSEKMNVVIHTTRGRTDDGRLAVAQYLLNHGLDADAIRTGKVKVTHEKPPALVYIDDRAYRFDGSNWPTVGEIFRLKPWHKEEA